MGHHTSCLTHYHKRSRLYCTEGWNCIGNTPSPIRWLWLLRERSRKQTQSSLLCGQTVAAYSITILEHGHMPQTLMNASSERTKYFNREGIRCGQNMVARSRGRAGFAFGGLHDGKLRLGDAPRLRFTHIYA